MQVGVRPEDFGSYRCSSAVTLGFWELEAGPLFNILGLWRGVSGFELGAGSLEEPRFGD